MTMKCRQKDETSSKTHAHGPRPALCGPVGKCHPSPVVFYVYYTCKIYTILLAVPFLSFRYGIYAHLILKSCYIPPHPSTCYIPPHPSTCYIPPHPSTCYIPPHPSTCYSCRS